MRCNQTATVILDWFIGLTLVSVVGFALFGVASISFGDDVDYWRARAAAAIAIQLERTKVRSTVATGAADPDTRPIVTGYSTKACSRQGYPCWIAKEAFDAAGKDLPFQLRWVDISDGGGPPWCDQTPSFEWDTPQRVRYVRGWPGLKEFVAIWKANQGKSK